VVEGKTRANERDRVPRALPLPLSSLIPPLSRPSRSLGAHVVAIRDSDMQVRVTHWAKGGWKSGPVLPNWTEVGRQGICEESAKRGIASVVGRQEEAAVRPLLPACHPCRQ
jgi:hypothetical protein